MLQNRSAYIVPSAKIQKWKTAVHETLSVQNKTVEERFDFFFNMFASKREKRQKLVGIAENVRRKKRIKREVDSPPRESPPFKEAARRCSSRLSKLIKPDITVSECSLSDTDTSSKFSVNSTHSLEAQAALYKRNNIFKGAYKGRVCEICETQDDDVFKCKDCSGYFHAACTRKVAKEAEGPKKENENVADGVPGKEGAPTSKEDIKDLPIEKQIELRMKEIMKKFDDRSVYADSTSDSGHSEDSGAEKMQEVRNNVVLLLVAV